MTHTVASDTLSLVTTDANDLPSGPPLEAFDESQILAAVDEPARAVPIRAIVVLSVAAACAAVAILAIRQRRR